MEERSSAELKCEILYGGAFQCGTDEVLLIIVIEQLSVIDMVAVVSSQMGFDSSQIVNYILFLYSS